MIDEAYTEREQQTKLNELSASQLVDHLAVLLQGEQLPERRDIEALKSAFYRLKERATEVSDIEQLVLQEERLNDLLKQYKELDRKRIEAQEALWATNKAKAEELFARLEALLSSDEDFRKIYEQFHEIREAWEQARPLSGQDESRLRKEFASLRERFYELKNINEELREYDFRKNLEAKEALLTELRPLAEDSDIVHALRRMNDIALRWHNLGPVAHSERQRIHAEYKELSTSIYKRHQDYQDARKQSEQANHEAKEGLIARLEGLLAQALPTTRKAWEEATEEVKRLQAEWKTLGKASRRDNDKLYQRLRASIDSFFQLKSDYYTQNKSEQEANLTAKQTLIARAKELRESTDWQKTSEALKALQEEWKRIGSVSQRHSGRIWEEFRSHMDYFFERKKSEGGDKKGQEQSNLAAKQALLKELRSLRELSDNTDLQVALKELSQKWQAIGHVPYKEKEAIASEYKTLMDELYHRLRSDRSQRRLDGYSASIKELAGDKQALNNELRRMERIMERLKSELRAYDNNLALFSISSKGGSNLLKEAERKRTELEQEIALLAEKIALLKTEANK